MELRTIKTPAGTLMKDSEGHRVFFLCDKSKRCKISCDFGCSHTLYLERSLRKLAYSAMFEHEFTKYFEKLYFNDTDYDWWEKEEPDESVCSNS